MRVLILGKSGFIGRNLYERLVSIDTFDIDAPSHQELNVLDEVSTVAILKRGSYDVVLNCLDRHAVADARYAEERLRMFCNLAYHSDLYGKMIYFGTGAEYARQYAIKQVSEKDFGRAIPLDSYGFALYQMAQFTLRCENIIDFRLFGIFGKYELWHQRFISNCICKALCAYPLTIRQDRVMDYLYIDDLCKMVEWALTNNLRERAYNATSGKQYRLTGLAEAVLKATGQFGELPVFVAKEGFASEYTSDNRLLASEMGGFIPEPIEDSIAKLVAYYAEHRDEIDRELLLYQ